MVVVVGSRLLERESFEILARIASDYGDQQMMVVDGEEKFPEDTPLYLPWRYEVLESALPNTALGHIVAHSFSTSEEWGLASHPEFFGILGGSVGFMERFIEESGGESKLHGRFMEAVSEGDIGFGETHNLLVSKILELVGWDSS